jgi:hypothetical protein
MSINENIDAIDYMSGIENYNEDSIDMSRLTEYNKESIDFFTWIVEKEKIKKNSIKFKILFIIIMINSMFEGEDENIKFVPMYKFNVTLDSNYIIESFKRYANGILPFSITDEDILKSVTHVKESYTLYLYIKEVKRIAARDEYDRKHPLSLYNKHRTWSEALFGYGTKTKRSRNARSRNTRSRNTRSRTKNARSRNTRSKK